MRRHHILTTRNLRSEALRIEKGPVIRIGEVLDAGWFTKEGGWIALYRHSYLHRSCVAELHTGVVVLRDQIEIVVLHPKGSRLTQHQ